MENLCLEGNSAKRIKIQTDEEEVRGGNQEQERDVILVRRKVEVTTGKAKPTCTSNPKPCRRKRRSKKQEKQNPGLSPN